MDAGWWKRWTKEVVARTLQSTGLAGVNRVAQRIRLGGRRLRIVSYHRVVEDFASEEARAIPGLLVSVRTLRRQLSHLGDRYEIVSLTRALDEMRASPAGSDLAAVTFDDGYADLWENGLPVLRALSVPASVFIVTALTGSEEPLLHDRLYCALVALERGRGDIARLPPGHGRQWLAVLQESGCRPPEMVDGLLAAIPDPQLRVLVEDLERISGLSAADVGPGGRLLSWEMVRDLAAAGHDIGAHTTLHRVLTHLPLPEVRRELSESRRAIVERLGREPAAFAYPNGLYSSAVIAEALAAGYRCAVTTEARQNGPGQDPFRLGRFTLWEGSTRGPRGYSPSIAACQFDGSFETLGIPLAVSGLVAHDPEERRGAGLPTR